MKRYPLAGDLVRQKTVQLASNPAGLELGDTSGDDEHRAIAKYEQFHRLPPTKIGAFASGFTIPRTVHLGGKGKWVTYRSSKVDPATLKKPKRPVDYIHEFDAGVKIYLTHGDGERVDVPDEYRDVEALTRLGLNLGFCFVDDDGEVEAVSEAPMPELYAIPSGHCLLVVQSKKKVLAMMWGGGLCVEARGIDG